MAQEKVPPSTPDLEDDLLDDPPISPARERSILDQRARLLAREISAENVGEIYRVVTFEVAEQAYAVELEAVREVLRLEDFTPVPGAPPAIVGIANIHGEMLALVDCRTFLGLPARGVSNLGYVMVLSGDHPQMGILVDAVGEIRVVMAGDMSDPPVAIEPTERACVRGVTSDGTLVLDGARMLADPRLFVFGGRA